MKDLYDIKTELSELRSSKAECQSQLDYQVEIVNSLRRDIELKNKLIN